jgi:hypothetical protein
MGRFENESEKMSVFVHHSVRFMDKGERAGSNPFCKAVKYVTSLKENRKDAL